MDAELKVPLLRAVEKHYSNKGNLYLLVDDCFKVLDLHKLPQDKKLRKDNFETNKKKSIIKIEFEKYCDLSTFILYCYEQRGRHGGCKKVCEQIEGRLWTRTSMEQYDYSALSIYRKIKYFQFGKHDQLLKWTINNFKILPKDIPSLVHEHRDQGFSEFE